MCGCHLADLPPIPGWTPPDSTLIMSWFYPLYAPHVRAKIRAVWKKAGGVDVVLDWGLARILGNYTPHQFIALCQELASDGFRPCPFLCSKDFDPWNNVPEILDNIQPLLEPLVACHIVPRVCIGFELGIDGWLTYQEVQQLNDAIAPPLVRAGIKVYNHYQARYMIPSNQLPDNATWWNAQVGLLTGLLAQSDPNADEASTRDWINDCLERAAGNDGMPADLIDGHGMDLIGCELTASRQFDGSMTEAQGNAFAQYILATPSRSGPAGTVTVMGSGNGFTV